jgi:hypothetical protein
MVVSIFFMVEMGRRYIDMAYKGMLLRLDLIRIIPPHPPHPREKKG